MSDAAPLLLTSGVVPDNLRIKRHLGIVQVTRPIELWKMSLFPAPFPVALSPNDADALDYFRRQAPKGTNLIYGVRISTAVSVLDKRVILWATYMGTAAQCEERKPNSPREQEGRQPERR